MRFFFFKRNSFFGKMNYHASSRCWSWGIFCGGWVGWSRFFFLDVRWSPVPWLNLQMAGRREMWWYVFLFFWIWNNRGGGGEIFRLSKKEADEEMMIEIEDVLMKHKFFSGDFLEKQISSVEFLILQPMFLWYPVIFGWLEVVFFWILSVRFRTRRMKPCLIHTWFQKTLEFLKWLNLPIRLQMLGFLQTQWSWMEHFTLKGRFPGGLTQL